ncbi:hypothetical protein N658DRAFT_487966 [Parathielavia hyrcaniae]|uniref:Uncharacterized protein n=1 Tax=Parathielavia hyrcaniae TaxID=113614 RepID=A0AAN6SZR0_9PEZI|nr:hypothetical protein N658DRAFT_487966 [Parathielavia hyrcaniae]
MATRHLYHEPLTWSYENLANTIVARTDLAQLVRVLRIDLDDVISFNARWLFPEALAHFNTRFQAYLDPMPDEGERKDEAQVLLVSLEEDLDMPEESGNRFNIAVDIMTSLWPNLEILCSMMRLRTMIIGCDEDLSTGADTRLTFLARVLRAAPNIIRMTLHRVLLASRDSPDLGLTLNKVTFLDLRDSILNVNDLVAFVTLCPNLETFKYEAGGPTSQRTQSSLARPS